jgi:hypothetical protein
MYIYGDISLNSSEKEKSEERCGEKTHFMFNKISLSGGVGVGVLCCLRDNVNNIV